MSNRKLTEEVRELREEIKRLRECIESRPYWPAAPGVVPGPGNGYQPFPQFVPTLPQSPTIAPWPFPGSEIICKS